MGMWIGRNRKARVTYGFDEIALVPGRVTVNPNEIDTTFRLPRKNAEPISARIRQIKDGGALAAVSSIPQRAAEFGALAQEAGADVFVVQSTVSTVRHVSSEYKSLDLAKFCADMRIPVIVGNTVGYDVTL